MRAIVDGEQARSFHLVISVLSMLDAFLLTGIIFLAPGLTPVWRLFVANVGTESKA